MTHFGTIKTYDTDKGRGMIAPEKGGEPLAFVKADLQKEAAAPKAGERFGYETRKVEGGKAEATKLQLQTA